MESNSRAFDGSHIAATDPVGQNRAQMIVDAAYELLNEEGLDGLTIRAVLARTGLARRAFYEQFAGKDDLVLAVFEHTLRAAAAYFRERAEELPGPLEAIRMIVVGLVMGGLVLPEEEEETTDRRSAALSREHLRLAESRPDDLQKALRPLIGLIAEQVSKGITAGQFRGCDPQLQARLIYNLAATTIHNELIAGEADEADAAERQVLADAIWEFCRRAIIA